MKVWLMEKQYNFEGEREEEIFASLDVNKLLKLFNELKQDIKEELKKYDDEAISVREGKYMFSAYIRHKDIIYDLYIWEEDLI